MKKIPKFLFCQNKMAKTKDIFILHTQKPEFLCHITNTDPFEVEIIKEFKDNLQEYDIPAILTRMKSSWLTNKNDL